MADEQLLQKVVAAVGREEVSLPVSLENNQTIAPFLFEGRSAGRGRLTLTARYQGVPVVQKQVALSLFDISYFYDHFIVEKSGSEDDLVNPEVNPEVNPVGPALTASRLALYEPSSDDYLLFVHGWNVKDWLKKRWAETTFKRLWWQGYKGAVGLFDWPCRVIPSWDVALNYDRSEFIAWKSAPALQKLLAELNGDHPGEIRIMAHSQGNVVAGEGLRLAQAGVVHSYVAAQAALSSSFYEADVSSVQPPLKAFTIETPEVYGAYPDPNGTRPYLSEVAGKVGALISYNNYEDYALTGDHDYSLRWETNNRTKPDGLLSYGYEGGIESYPPPLPAIGFYQTRSRMVGDVEEFYRAPLLLPEDAHEVYSFGAESRTRALGAAYALPSFLPHAGDFSLRGSRNLNEEGFDRTHLSHSKQFRSNIVDEQFYWQALVNDASLEAF